MRAITVIPGQAGSAALEDVPEPDVAAGALLVDGLALGICGTDGEIVRGEYGWAPPGAERLVLGHESLGRVREAPGGLGVRGGRPRGRHRAAAGRGAVRPVRGGGVGLLRERRVHRARDRGARTATARSAGASSRTFAIRLDPELEDVGVLLEPTGVVAKAWEQIERIGARATFAPRRVLVTGAGPIGLLGGAAGRASAATRCTCSTRSPTGRSPSWCARLGAHLPRGARRVGRGRGRHRRRGHGRAGRRRRGAARAPRRNGIVCLTGVSSGGRPLEFDIGGFNRDVVLENDVVFGTVNANRRHYEAAATALGEGRPRLAARADHPPRAARPLAGGARAAAGRREGGRRACAASWAARSGGSGSR